VDSTAVSVINFLGTRIDAAGRLSGCAVVGYGHRRSTIKRATEIGAIDEAYEDPAEAVRGADLIVLCTPVGFFSEVLKGISTGCKPGAIVTDVGSTKRSVVQQAEQLLPPTVHFVGSHPMAGSEKRGVEFARADLFAGALCILTPNNQTDSGALGTVEEFWKSLGMRTLRLDPAAHDRLVGDISHVPHAVAAALVALQDDLALYLAGKGFLDTTRVAGGDGALWRDIFIDNRDNVRRGIKDVAAKLNELASLMDPEKADELRAWLDAAAKRRDELVQRKLRELEGS
jgi:prephenate dehydrogenase